MQHALPCPGNCTETSYINCTITIKRLNHVNFSKHLLFNTPYDRCKQEALWSMNESAAVLMVSLQHLRHPPVRHPVSPPTDGMVIWSLDMDLCWAFQLSKQSSLASGSHLEGLRWNHTAGRDEGSLWPLPHLSPFTLQPVEKKHEWSTQYPR